MQLAPSENADIVQRGAAESNGLAVEARSEVGALSEAPGGDRLDLIAPRE